MPALNRARAHPALMVTARPSAPVRQDVGAGKERSYRSLANSKGILCPPGRFASEEIDRCRSCSPGLRVLRSPVFRRLRHDERAAQGDRRACATGQLRASINDGNPVLAQRDPATASRGASPRTLRASSATSGAFRSSSSPSTPPARCSTDGELGRGTSPFLAIDPARAAGSTSPPRTSSSRAATSCRSSSPLRAIGDVDREGCGSRSATERYDLYLAHAKRAQLVRARPGRPRSSCS